MAEPPSYDHQEDDLDVAAPPPPYGDARSERLDNRPLPPISLRMVGRFIHADDGQSAPMYELSHDVAFLNDSDSVVRLQRQSHGAPQRSTRARHLFDLKHPRPIIAPTFPYHAEAISRQSLCSLGITSYRPRRLSTARAYRIHRAARGTDNRLVGRTVIFDALPARHRNVAYEWFDSQSRLLARELAQQGMMSLLIGTEMSSGARDALVAAWILKVWWELARGPNRMSPWYYSNFLPLTNISGSVVTLRSA